MGELLKEVRSTNDRGLVGITQEGKEIPLGSPKPVYAVGSSEEHTSLLNQAGKEGYVQFGDEVQKSLTDIPLIIGNIYERRK